MSTPPVILIIEDEDFLRSSLADYLEDHGHTVMTSPNVEDGLRQVETGKPRICIVDMRLPDMNGNEFILRANSIDPSIRFVIFTGSVEYNLPESLSAIGLTTSDILFKPLTDMNVLLSKIAELTPAS